MAVGVQSTVVSTDLGHVPSSGKWRTVQPEELPANADVLDLRLHPVRPPRRFAFSPTLTRHMRIIVPAHDLVHIHSLWLHPQ